ncbi:hypothetical protein [Tautonia marina]|uniref:hypothetical protein n=1 Tax=Tautonia marina TaxID=2653855 RepID=UPI0012611223|nr:hypothetical protein [Tautonia marina]
MARYCDLLWIGVVLTLLMAPGASLAQDDADPASEDGAEPAARSESVSPVVIVRSGEQLEDVARSALSGVTAVEVVGHVPEDGGLARLSLTITLYARGPGPHRVPIGLDGLYPREAESDGVPLGWEAAPPDGWFVILPGQRDEEQLRTVRVDVVAPVRSIDDRKGLTLAIPRAIRTRLQLDLEGPIAEATLGDGAPLPVEMIDKGRRSRIEAMLDARSELEIRWLPRRDEAAPVPPLLTGGGHISLDLSEGALTAQSIWEIQVRRGEVSTLVFLPDPDEEILEIETEGRSIPPASTLDGRGRLLSLPRTIRKGESIRVAITTRRPVPTFDPETDLASVRFVGHPFEGVIEQTGTLSIGRTDGLRILADPEDGLRRIDPRDLREEIARARPTILSAFRFANQPFGLQLRVGPMPPMVRVAQRSFARIEPGGASAKVESWLDYRSVRGQCFNLRVEVPEGLEIDRVGPPEAISTWDLVRPDDSEATSGPVVLEMTLASALRDGQQAPLRIKLEGTVRFDPERPGQLSVFRPLDAGFDGGRLAVAVPPELDVAPSNGLEAQASAEVIPTDPSAILEAGPWASTSEELPRRVLWLRFEAPAAVVPLTLTARASTVSSTIDQLVRVARDGIDVQQDLTLYAPDGELKWVDLAIPAGLERGWELVDRGVIEQEEPIPPGPDGLPIRRLTLAQPVSGAPVKLRLRYRLQELGRLVPGESALIEIPRIEVLDPRPASPPRVEIAADPGIELRPEGEGWRRPAENQWVTNPDGGAPLPIRQVWVRPPGAASVVCPRFSATASAPAELPKSLASRLWLRSEQGADGEVRIAAWFRFDDHGPSLGFRLPYGAELDRVYLDGEPVPSDDLDALERPGMFLLHLPAETARGVLVGMSYRLPPEAAGSRWQPPRLLDGGRVFETLWEVRVPWNQALVGVPRGFTDENLWYWAGYVWKRQPGMSPSELAVWIGGPGSSAETLAPPLTGGRNGDHGYLFSRPGNPGSLNAMIVSRATLVGCCSGVVLLFGLLVLIRHPIRARVLPIVGAVALLVLILMGPSTSIVVVQSSAVGWLLIAVAVLTRRAVELRRPGPRFGEQSALGSTPAASDQASGMGGSGGSTPLVGSDDSTAIRPRPPLVGPPSLSSPRPDSNLRDEVIDLAPPTRSDHSPAS